MNEIQVRFQKYKDFSELSNQVPLDMRLGDARDAIQTLLGLPDNGIYRLGLVRNSTILNEQLSFQEANIEPNDHIILIAPEELQEWQSQFVYQGTLQKNSIKSVEGNDYKLIVSTKENLEDIWEYSVKLKPFYENNPHDFFNKENQQERIQFDKALSRYLHRELRPQELEKILKTCCAEILQGYRTTSIKIN
jgi:hypothetical protein